MADTRQRAVAVYLSARVYDPNHRPRHYSRREVLKANKRAHKGAQRFVWSLVLERWTPDEVRDHIIELFTKLAAEDACLTTTNEHHHNLSPNDHTTRNASASPAVAHTGPAHRRRPSLRIGK